MIDVDLYVATGCHLCPPAIAAAMSVVGAPDMGDARLRVIDIDGDLALEHRYREAIPVLVVGGIEAARYVFDEHEVRRAIVDARRVSSPPK